MPCLSGTFDPTQGIFINIAVAKPGQIIPGPTQLKVPTFLALIDTGATRTCISKQAATVAGLVATGKLPMVSATHTIPMDVYLADLFLPFGKGGVVVNNMQIMEFNCDPNCPFQILLGRDVLTKGLLSISFDGHFSFSI